MKGLMTGEGGDSATAFDRFADSAAAATSPRTTVGGGEGVHANVDGGTAAADGATFTIDDSVGSVLGKKVAAVDAAAAAA